MALLQNLKLKVKLGLGFSLLLLITLIITIIGIINIWIVDADYTHTLDYTLARYSVMRDLEVEMMDLRRIIAMGAFRLGNAAAIDELENELNATRDTMRAAIGQFINVEFTSIDDIHSFRLEQILNLNDLISGYMTHVAYPVLAAARAGDAETVHRLHFLATDISENIYAQFDVLFAEIRGHIADIAEHNNQTVRATMFMLGGLGGGSMLIGIVIAVFITNAITKPVREVVSALKRVANGDLSVNLPVDSTDEIGILTQSTQDLAGTLHELMQDMDNMSTAHDKGDIDVFIPGEKFAGAYSEVARKINYMVNSHLKIQNRLVDVFVEIAQSNFEIQLEQLPGKKAMLNDTVNTIRDTIWRQHKIYNANPIPGSLWDADANAIDCNEATIKLLGMSGKEDYIDKANFFNFSPEYQLDGTLSKEKHSEVFKQARQRGYYRFTWMHHTAKKEPIPCDITAVRIHLKDTCVFAVYLQDLRPLREADARIREAEEMNEIFLGASPFVMNIWDENLRLVSTSQQSVKMFGLSSQEQYIERFFELSPEHQPCGMSSREKALNYVKQALDDGYVQFEWMHQNLDREPIPSEITFVRFKRQGKFFAAAYTVDLRPAKAVMEKERKLKMKMLELKMSERIRHMSDAMPLMIEYWDKKCSAIDCNKTTLEYYGFQNKEEYKKRQVKSASGPPVWNKHLEEIFEIGFGSFEFVERRPNGDAVFEVDAMCMEYNGDTVVVTYSNDVTQLKEKEHIIAQAQGALIYRDKLLNTVNLAAKVLLTATRSDFEDALLQSMEMIGHCLDADRVQLWRVDLKAAEISMTRPYQWLSMRGHQVPQIDHTQKVLYGTLPKLEGIIFRKESINGPVANLPLKERRFLDPDGALKSVVIMPLFLHNQFWGFFSIDDCVNERTLSYEEMDILRSASLMIANTYNRMELMAKEQEANELNQVLIDAAPYVTALWDDTGKVISVSDQARDLFGIPDVQLIVDGLFSISPEFQPCGTPTPEKAAEQIGRAFKEDFVQFEWMHKTAKGEPLPAECTFKHFTRKGKDMLVSYTKDLREIKAAEEKKQKAQDALEYREKLLNTVNQAAEALLTANEEDTMKALITGMEVVGRCLDVDRVQIWRNEEIDGQLHFVMRHEWLSGFGKERTKIPIGLSCPYSERPGRLETFLRGESINTPISKLTPEEAAFLRQYEEVSVANLPLFLNKEFLGFFSVGDCRQERIFTNDEMDIVASAGLMFASVFNRNFQADKIAETNKKLESALENALAASRAKSDFLSVMSHEMRTPMNAIIGMTAIARKEAYDERKDSALGKVEKAAYYLLGIINDVLDMSKIEANKMELAHMEFDLNNLLQKAASLIDFRMDEKHHHFSMNINENIPRLYTGDEQRLMQVIINLLSNAAIYTPEEGVISLDVSLVKEEGEICELCFVITDNGVGISPEQQPRIFDMFERGNSNTNSKYGGTGLGLSITKHLIELMGGAISVESEAGKGSRFTFTVRLTRIEKAESLPSGSADAPTVFEDIKFTGKRLLLVEDIEINREIVIAQLSDSDLVIDTAENGKVALEMIKANPELYDLIFMDMQMPEMDGLEATRHIRSLPLNSASNLPIIAMTANVFAEDIDKCLAAGMNDHIGKPLDMRIVYEKLSRYLG